MPFLEIDRINKNFGGLRALQNVSFSVQEGEVFSVVGPNGSGKTTLFNVISGILRPEGGAVRLKGIDITGMAPFARAAIGIGRTFQNIMLFRNLTVLDNVLIGRHCRIRSSEIAAVVRTKSAQMEEAYHREKAVEILKMVDLAEKATELARNLAYGEQKRLEIARALAVEPALVLLDEPAAGTSSYELDELIHVIRSIHEMKKTIILIEHKMDMVMSISHRVHVLSYGITIAEGTPEEVASNQKVIEAYLGQKEG